MSCSNDMCISTSYLGDVYYKDRFSNTFKTCKTILKEFGKKNKFDTILFTGNSGAAFSYPLALSLKKHLLCLRKGKSHFGTGFEGNHDVRNYIIVDDFIETGDTIERLLKRTKKEFSASKCIGILLYSGKSMGRYRYTELYYPLIKNHDPIQIIIP